ncbi:kynureninase [Alteromonas sediminis]|uniref:Kynureninase n=1 Tax=Alteromonas sediminis TaxID=2259342 RepID=A0A3N5YLF6_9ALTE|nr:kynureninase [Alteromonas sediminis]RPJ65951.1 kynureninase [Alteromonas sediminis]
MIKTSVASLDNNDPLREVASQFHKPEGVIYLDGNSLGLMPHCVAKRIETVTREQWGNDLIASWNKHHWIDLSRNVGDKIASLLGADYGQVACCDSISINLFKVLCAALSINSERKKILSTEDNFPTDLYMVQGLEALLGHHRCELVMVEEGQLAEAVDEDTAAVLVTEVNFRTGNIVDIAGLTQVVHKHGALVIVDLAHSAGVLPIALDKHQIDFAVGCTYKYLNAGPGAPGFVYASKRHHEKLVQPLFGWMGHANGFAFSPLYSPAQDINQMLVGTPPVISLSAVDAALDIYDGLSLDTIRNKSKQLTNVFLELLKASNASKELTCISPLDAERRGSQLSFEFEHAYALCQALIEVGVIADFRAPNFIRFGVSPLYTHFHELAEAVEKINDILVYKTYLASRFQTRNKVT